MNDNVYLIIYILIGILISVFVVIIAEKKGRRGGELFAFWLLGLFFSVIGLIIVLVMEDKSGKTKAIKLVCEKCGQPQSATNKKCWNCGADLLKVKADLLKVKYGTGKIMDGKYLVCAKCNAIVSDSAKFCSNCGELFKEEPQDITTPSYCSSCGKKLNPSDKFCNSCGLQLNT